MRTGSKLPASRKPLSRNVFLLTAQTDIQLIGNFLSKILKLINNLSRENKENHYCDRGLDM